MLMMFVFYGWNNEPYGPGATFAPFFYATFFLVAFL